MLSRLELETARRASNRRVSKTVYGGHEHVLRQTVISLLAGHQRPSTRTPARPPCMYGRGRVSPSAGDNERSGSPGDLLIVPPSRHALTAIKDSVVLLTVAKLG